MKEIEVNANIPICIENFDALSKKYKPVILSNIKKVHKMYEQNASVEFDDLFQEGLIALYDSIQNFDPERGVYFGVYLKVAISNKLKCYCRNFLPHFYTKDHENSTSEKTKFKRMKVAVGSIDDAKNYMI
jgi:RNA polymerase sigma factor (sigma-70 family)